VCQCGSVHLDVLDRLQIQPASPHAEARHTGRNDHAKTGHNNPNSRGADDDNSRAGTRRDGCDRV